MPYPIRGRTLAQMLRPGWSAFGEKRAVGTHRGFDYYAPLGTPIYATGPGRVTYSGYLPNGHGHYVEVTLDDHESVRTVDSHMLRPTPLARGARVDENTQIGQVGATGNARNIFWRVNGVDLRHVHHEVRRGTNVHVGNVDPIPFHGGLSFAGGIVTPLPSLVAPAAPAPEPPKNGHDMYLLRTTDTKVYLVTANGMVGISSIAHLKLFERLFDSYPRWDTFNSAERDIIRSYIHAASTSDDIETAKIIAELGKIKPTIDLAALVTPLAAAVRSAIAEQGVEVDFGPVFAALEATAGDIKDRIDEQPVEFTIKPV